MDSRQVKMAIIMIREYLSEIQVKHIRIQEILDKLDSEKKSDFEPELKKCLSLMEQYKDKA